MMILGFGMLSALLMSTPTHALTSVKYGHFKPQNPSLHLAHGFHCRRMFGWDPRSGVYRWHQHKGICQDYQRCMKVMYRCDLLMGKGWEAWSYERWGFDNWRFDKCMLDAGCY
jgi:hypothetical protein